MKQPVPTEVKSDNSRREPENNLPWDIPGTPKDDPDHFERSCHPAWWNKVLTDFEYSPLSLITLYEIRLQGTEIVYNIFPNE